MVAELIKENRKLKRQVVKLTERGTKVASSSVDRTLRTIQRRVQKALTAPAKRKRRKTSAAATTRKRAVTRRRRKAS
jgi:septum formation inhibitor MinC